MNTELKSRFLVCQVSIAHGEQFLYLLHALQNGVSGVQYFCTTETPTMIVVVILFLGLNAGTGNDPGPSFHGSLSLESSLQEDERPRQPFDSGQLIGWLIETGFYVGEKRRKEVEQLCFRTCV